MAHRNRSVWLLLAVPAALMACSSDAKTASTGSSGSSSSASSAPIGATTQLAVSISDEGCSPAEISTPAGPTTFNVTNKGSSAVIEFEVLDGTNVLGEVENVEPGTPSSFSLTLKEGTYDTACPGGTTTPKGKLTVTAATSSSGSASEAATKAVADYVRYVEGEADLLTPATVAFADAVKAGDVAKAKQLFAAAREHYESIEPIAESFGDLDPAIDAREGDVPDAEWGGFHRIEKALWADGNATGMASVADKLVADVKKLRTSLDTIELEPAQIANGAVELLNEVSTSKITGEEDRYSHTDLSDFAANLSGSREAISSLSALITAKQPALLDSLNKLFSDATTALFKYKAADPIGNGYALYDTLTTADTKALSAAIDTLAEPLSTVAALVVA